MIAVVHGLTALGFFEATFADTGQWDFECYYYALKVYREGGDPYDVHALIAAAGHPIYPFVYPHHTLAFFSLFDLGDLAASKQAYLVVKFLALLVLAVLWTWGFVDKGARGWFLVFATLGFHAAIARDVTGGNVCAFEQLPIWLGLWALVHGYPALFCAGVILGAQFKVQPLALLALLWCYPVAHRWRYAVVSAVVVLTIALGVVANDPVAARSYVFGSTDLARGESGLSNPCAPALWRELMTMALNPYTAFDGINRGHAGNLVYIPYALTILVVTWRLLPRVGLGKRGIYLGILTFALTAPRMKDYSWNLVLVPAFELLREAIQHPRRLRVAIVIAFGLFTLPLRDAMWTYRAYWITLMLWAATLASAWEKGTEPVHHGEKTVV